MTRPENYMGRTDFVERHGLWGPGDAEHAARALRLIEENDLEVVRLSFADQHGLLRGKTILADVMPQAFRNGCTNTTTLLAKDTAHKTQFPKRSVYTTPYPKGSAHTTPFPSQVEEECSHNTRGATVLVGQDMIEWT